MYLNLLYSYIEMSDPDAQPAHEPSIGGMPATEYVDNLVILGNINNRHFKKSANRPQYQSEGTGLDQEPEITALSERNEGDINQYCSQHLGSLILFVPCMWGEPSDRTSANRLEHVTKKGLLAIEGLACYENQEVPKQFEKRAVKLGRFIAIRASYRYWSGRSGLKEQQEEAKQNLDPVLYPRRTVVKKILRMAGAFNRG